LDRLESSKKAYELIRITKQSKTTYWNQEQMNKTYLEIDIEWKWNWKMKDRKTYVVEAREEGSRHLEGE